jgi:inhibitor of KinA
MNVRFLHSGDTALVVEFGDRVDRELSDRVLRLSALIQMSNTTGVIETVPTFRSLMVLYDPLAIDSANLVSKIEKLLDGTGRQTKPGKLWRIPACYEPAYAPDLPEVAQRTGHSAQEIVELHAAVSFYVYMIGFVPGHPYMGDLPDWLALPRRSSPRVKVPAGSIAISGQLSVIYPLESPGGWHLIGATPAPLFDPRAARPSLLSPGDKVKFDPISVNEFDAIRRAVEAGSYNVPSEPIGA